MAQRPGEVTRLLVAWASGDERAEEELMPLVYGELRKLAVSYLRHEREHHTLETSALVHEAYVRLVDQRTVAWQGRHHFFGIAARMMRRILVDHARKGRYAKRGAGVPALSLDDVPTLMLARRPELVALDDALTDLAALSPRQAEIVELRFFAGLTREQVAEALGISVPTVSRQWRVARAWLYRQLRASDTPQVAHAE